MIKLKRILSFVIVIVVVFAFGINCERITDEIYDYISQKPELIINPDNGYRKNYQYQYIKETVDYVPNSKKELLEVFYTVLNMGWNEFTFYCPVEYTACLDDVKDVINDKILADFNNFVSSYNSYDTLNAIYDSTGAITVKVDYTYKSDEIELIDKDIDNLLSQYLNDSMSDYDKIKVMHDVIINRTKYDVNMADNDVSQYDSKRIQGVLYDGYAICSGYADIMEVILTKLNVPNYKIASDTHVWNAVYLDNTWYHLDVTWDDPTTNTGEDILTYDYFLVDNSMITKDDDINVKEHDFDLNKYKEFATQ